MRLSDFLFAVTDWQAIEPTEHRGERGVARWHTQQFGEVRVRMVEYSPDYVADHWCEKGHVVLCLEGELRTELRDGTAVTLRPGMSYQVADGVAPHRSAAPGGARLFIVD
jgi:quercetin dioxygenase-like cupin family protein